MREANFKDAELLLLWANDPLTREYALCRNKIKRNEHEAWLKKKLLSDSYILIAESNLGYPIGQIRFDNFDSYFLIDFYVAKSYRGYGYGKCLLRDGIEYILKKRERDLVKFKAIVNQKNLPSINSFLSVGFIYQSSEIINNQKFNIYLKEF